ncbi:MAG TPA: D-2-hydroxyacid dehydrogenase family protein [Acidimicrobiales bacterium]|nr:D-2-hydroxyacid dehydrogenase family protein [Acidimicrobiales bacterium]
MTAVAVLDDYQGRAHALADWAALGYDVTLRFFFRAMDEDTLVGILSEFDIVVLMRERTALPRQVIEQLPRLQLVVTTGMVNAAVDRECLRERGITYAGTGGSGSAGPVEIAWSLIFATTKRTVIEDAAIRAGHWQLGFPALLSGKTLGLLGLGRLGSAMVPAARAFGMEVVAWSENLTAARTDEVGVELVTKQALLERSDVLSIHLLLSRRTRGLLGADDFFSMKRSAVLINTSRGPIVEEQALVDALRAGRIAAAGLDVFDVEPLPTGHPFLALENAVLAPHLGYVSEEGMEAMYSDAVEDIAAFLAGEPIRVIE